MIVMCFVPFIRHYFDWCNEKKNAYVPVLAFV